VRKGFEPSTYPKGKRGLIDRTNGVLYFIEESSSVHWSDLNNQNGVQELDVEGEPQALWVGY